MTTLIRKGGIGGWALLAACCWLLAACGLKGDLYLPAESGTPAPATAPAEPDDETEERRSSAD